MEKLVYLIFKKLFSVSYVDPSFRLREYLDSLDGYVARELSGDPSFTVDFQSFGSYVDRIADGFGYVFVGFGFIGYLYRSHGRKHNNNNNNNSWNKKGQHQQQLLPFLDCRNPRASYDRIPPEAKAGLLAGIQMIYASILWNYFTVVLRDIFETNMYGGDSPGQKHMRTELFSAGSTCVLFYIWRNLNHQSLMHAWFLASIYDKCLEYADVVKYVGFSFITLAGFVSFLHTKYLIFRIENTIG